MTQKHKLGFIDEMTKQGYGSLGTLRQRCLQEWEMPCGSTDVLTEGETLLMQWKDNSGVTMATNAVERYSDGQASRWSKEKKSLRQSATTSLFPYI